MDDLDLGATLKGFAPGQKVFNRYTLVKILGRGGMGVVWLARDGELERDVALKFLPEIVALDAEAVADLKRETRRNLDLTHPHIVRIYDFIQDGRSAAISMEYVDGASLAVLKLEKPDRVFSPGELVPWVEQLCTALTYAHTKAKIVHRDLKPANLMITKGGDLKITDFGIARGISDSVSRVSAQIGGSSGTPVYMSPQQMMGEKPAVTDDIYAVGATLYELLTGKPPFHSGNIIMQVQSKVPPPVSERLAELGVQGKAVSSEWDRTIAACLAKEQTDRPQSSHELAARLGMKGSPVADPAAGTSKPVASETKPPPGARPASDALPVVPSEKKKSAIGWLLAAVAGVIALGGVGYYLGIHRPEQQRLAEIARLEAAGRAADALRLKNERERAELLAKEQADREQREYAVVRARIDSVLDGAPPAQVEAAEAAITAYLASSPERYQAEIQAAWTLRKAAWETARLAAARGGVVVRTNPPGAEVRVGAIALDKSPLTLRDQRLGSYPVRIRLPGYDDWDGTVEVKENEFAELNVTLTRSTGRVVISGQEGAEIFQDGRRLGTVPLSLPAVPTGEVRYTVTAFGHEPAQINGEVIRSQELRLVARLEALPRPRSGQPHENTLGMRFVPVPGTRVLFSTWETRVKDFDAFVRDSNHNATGDMSSYNSSGNWGKNGATWRNPGFPQTEDHPVVGVTMADANAFCAWLTRKERAEGRLGPDQQYRLPTNAEWTAAAGNDPYPWGAGFPPAGRVANIADAMVKNRFSGWSIIPNYHDGYDVTAPVGSFPANRHGLYDLSGNVWELVSDTPGMSRGGAWDVYQADSLATQKSITDNTRATTVGFRIVCDHGP